MYANEELCCFSPAADTADMLTADVDSNPVRSDRATENSITWDLDDIYDLLQELESNTATAPSLPSALPLNSGSPGDWIQPPTMSQFDSGDYQSNGSFTSPVLDDNDRNILMNIINMLLADISCNPVNEKTTADKATETTSMWDLDDIDIGDLFQGLPSTVDLASLYSLADEAPISVPTTKPVYSSTTDTIQPSTASYLGNSCTSLTVNCPSCHAGR